MKLTDLMIIFIIISIPFNYALGLQSKNVEAAFLKQVEMNRILDTAVEDGVAMLFEKADSQGVILNKERAVNAFYQSLFLNLGILIDEYAQIKVMGYIPVLLVVDRDGFYVLANEAYVGADGYQGIKPVWQAKKSYSYFDGQYTYGFTLDDELTVYDTLTGEFYVGKQGDLKATLSSALLQDAQVFDQVRRRTIIECLQNEMNYYINQHNKLARQYGISYHFSLPVIEEEDWYRTIDDIGMLAFFQGMPMGIAGKCYNNFAFGGARIIKSELFYLEEVLASGLTYYHRSDCTQLTQKNIGFNNQEKCALEGAFPCHLCKP